MALQSKGKGTKSIILKYSTFEIFHTVVFSIFCIQDLFVFILPRAGDVGHRQGGGQVLRDEEAAEDPLEVSEDLLGVVRDGCVCLRDVAGEEDWNRSVHGIAVEGFCLNWLLLEEDRRCCVSRKSLMG